MAAEKGSHIAVGDKFTAAGLLAPCSDRAARFIIENDCVLAFGRYSETAPERI
jgi:hypothetical protein